MHRPRRLLLSSLLALGTAASVLGAPSAASADLPSVPPVLPPVVQPVAPVVPRLSAMSSTESSYVWAVLRTINAQRTRNGMGPVRLDRNLTLAADRHNRVMARANSISHQLRGERDFVGRDRAAGWKARCASGENIGVHSRMDLGGAVELQVLMYNERPPYDGHRRNTLNRRYTDVGIAVLLDRRNGRLWLSTDYARRRC